MNVNDQPLIPAYTFLWYTLKRMLELIRSRSGRSGPPSSGVEPQYLTRNHVFIHCAMEAQYKLTSQTEIQTRL